MSNTDTTAILIAERDGYRAALEKIAALQFVTKIKHPLMLSLSDGMPDPDGFIEISFSMKDGMIYAARIAAKALNGK